METICFLHAYSCLIFETGQLQKNLTCPYLLLFRRQNGAVIRLAPDCVRLRIGLDQGMTARETSRHNTCAVIKLINLRLIKQRERN